MTDNKSTESASIGRREPWVWGPYSRYGLTIAVFALILDQFNKWWMINVYDIGGRGRVEALPFLDLVYVLNRGISYSLFTLNSQEGQYLLASFAFLVAVVLVILL
ncbi:MAG: signal peptidase II, partial [Pseudomonadota bacterium]